MTTPPPRLDMSHMDDATQEQFTKALTLSQSVRLREQARLLTALRGALYVAMVMALVTWALLLQNGHLS